MSVPTLGLGYLIGLFGVVALGAVVPIVPTGAAVSAAAALAEKDNLLLVLAVIALGAAGAYVGDIATYGVLRLESRRIAHGSGRLTRWLHKPREEEVLARVERQIESHALRTLVLSRLVPGGQTPVLLAAAASGYRWARYAVADIGATTLWSAVYAATGVVGRAVFSGPLEGVAAGIALVLLISLASAVWSRLRRRASD
jgi:membrane protein DedA with SNARE-associated domain